MVKTIRIYGEPVKHNKKVSTRLHFSTSENGDSLEERNIDDDEFYLLLNSTKDEIHNILKELTDYKYE